MGLLSQSVTIGTAATLIVGETQSPKTVIISGASVQNVYIGNGSVTTSNGTQADHISGVPIRLNQTDVMYGVVATGTHVIQVLTIT